MPDTGGSSSGRTGTASAKGGGTWITRKIGPLPVWAYGVIAVGAYYWYTHYGPGASKSAASSSGGKGGGLKTYAPHITETITERAPRGRGHRRKDEPEPKRKPPKRHHPRPPSSHPPGPRAPNAGPMAPAGTGPNPGGPAKRPGRHRRPPPPPPPGPPPPEPGPVPPGPEQVASANYQPAGMQTGGAVNADTNQPVYWEWQHAHRGPEVPMPVQAYAPQTSGAIYDAASTGASIAAS